MTMLEVRGLNAGYAHRQVLTDVSFSVSGGEMVGILGANGSGKTTLLKVLCGILPGKGDYHICGEDIRKMSPKQLSKVSRYIPQRCGISIDISLLDVVLMGFNPELNPLSGPDKTMIRTAEEALETVGLGSRKNTNFLTLSEGQKQLCILARTLLLRKGVLLLDEPESALDFRERYRMLGLVRNWMKQNTGCALVTLHDPQLALNACDRLLLMRDGIIVDEILPAHDSAEKVQASLSGIFGDLSVHRCEDRSGAKQLVLIKEG